MMTTSRLLAASAVAAFMAAPLAAEEVPLNTVTGGTGQAQVQGQGLMAGSLLGSGVAMVGALAVVMSFAAASDSDDSTND